MVRVRVGVRVGARVRARVTEGDGRRQLGDLITERGTLEDGLWVGGATHEVDADHGHTHRIDHG